MLNATDRAIPAWAMQVADDYHGAQSVDVGIAELVARVWADAVRASAEVMCVDLLFCENKERVLGLIERGPSS